MNDRVRVISTRHRSSSFKASEIILTTPHCSLQKYKRQLLARKPLLTRKDTQCSQLSQDHGGHHVIISAATHAVSTISSFSVICCSRSRRACSWLFPFLPYQSITSLSRHHVAKQLSRPPNLVQRSFQSFSLLWSDG